MRLINTTTGKFQEFFDTQRPPYSILSHTWGEQEISYLDMLFMTSDLPANAVGVVQALLRNPSKDSEGYQKVQACCNLARNQGFEWVWIDSCCIDKSSSAELSEAINSMWSWYRDAAECYVYLSDVWVSATQLQSDYFAAEQLGRARWFSRGWTLQELLAPTKVIFYNSRWEKLSTKVEIGKQLSQITKIPLVFLHNQYDPSDCTTCSAAMKMSWLSRRQTTRVEDMAYCMLGLFDVHMPLIYGEGRRAFMRLQLEIVKKIDDESLYAWKSNDNRSGLLATWPDAFKDSGNIVQVNFPEDESPWTPPEMTSIGLKLTGRYQRNDPQQRAIDEKHNVHTYSTAIPYHHEQAMVMHCSPCKPDDIPITQQWRRWDHGKAFLLYMKRFGATWQRVRCDRLEFATLSMYEPSPLDANLIYYIAQPGL